MARKWGAAWASRERPRAMNMEGAFKAHFIRVRVDMWWCFALITTQVAGVDTGVGSIPSGDLAEAPENAAEKAEDTAGVALGGREPAQQQTQVVAIGGLHGARGVAGRNHGFFDDGCEEVEAGSRRGGRVRSDLGDSRHQPRDRENRGSNRRQPTLPHPSMPQDPTPARVFSS